MPIKKEYKKYLKDIQASLKQLNKLGIAYIDLKIMNTGYSKKDKVWKLFDFDLSSIYKKNKWISKNPFNHSRIQPIFVLGLYIHKKNLDLKPSEIDTYLFKYFKKHIEKGQPGPAYSYLDEILPNWTKKFIKLLNKKKSHKSRKSRKSKKSHKLKKTRKSRKYRKSSRKSRKSSKTSCKGMKSKDCKKNSKNCIWRRKTIRAKAHCLTKRR